MKWGNDSISGRIQITDTIVPSCYHHWSIEALGLTSFCKPGSLRGLQCISHQYFSRKLHVKIMKNILKVYHCREKSHKVIM